MSKITYDEGFTPAKKVVSASVAPIALGLLIALLTLAVLQAPSRPAYAQTDRLPDLRMDYPKSLQIENTSDGRKLLRFSSIVVNVGAGPFELHGQRAADASTMTTSQRIFDDAGGFRDVPTSALIFWGGDGHNHWHVQDLLDFELQRYKNGGVTGEVSTFAKQGFCFFDNYNYGSPEPAFYTPRTGACGGGLSATQTRMGLSVGWGDRYGRLLPGQYIDITGLTPGRYRLTGTADAQHWFQECDNTNNLTWVNINLRTDGTVRIFEYGPSATPSSTPSPSCQTTPMPQVSIADASVNEGNSSISEATFTVTLSEASTTPVTVDYATEDGTATQPDDYQQTGDTLTFGANETTKTVTVPVSGDTADEPDESFKVLLSNPQNAELGDGEASGTIVDDDEATPTDTTAPSVESIVPTAQ